MNALKDLFGHADTGMIPGGCDRCDAYQTLESVGGGLSLLLVHHDDGCPVLRAMNGAALASSNRPKDAPRVDARTCATSPDGRAPTDQLGADQGQHPSIPTFVATDDRQNGSGGVS